MGDDHGVARRRSNLSIHAERVEVRGDHLSGAAGISIVFGVGAHAGDAEKLKESLQSEGAVGLQVRKNVGGGGCHGDRVPGIRRGFDGGSRAVHCGIN